MKNWCTEDKINALSDSAKNVLIMELSNQNKKITEELNVANEKLRIKQVEPYILSSEQTPYLFNELEELSRMLDNDESYKEDNTKASRKVPHKVRKLPANTPITIIDHTKDNPETIIGPNGYTYSKIENKVVDKIGFTPAKYYIERHIYSSYKIKDFEPEKDDIKSITLWDNAKTDVLAASTSLVAKTVIKKYADALPLYRQEQIFKRAGIEISRQTLSNWLLTYANLLEPLKNRYKHYLLQSPLINQEETPTQVLNIDKEDPTKTRFMLVRIGTSYQNSEQDRVIVQFSFIPNRKIETLSTSMDIG
jgi:transposase